MAVCAFVLADRSEAKRFAVMYRPCNQFQRMQEMPLLSTLTPIQSIGSAIALRY